MKFFIVLFLSAWTLMAHAETVDTNIGAAETSQHKTPDDRVDTAQLQEILTASHEGVYVLGFLGVGYHKAKLVHQVFKSYSTQYGGILGYGRILSDKRYLGVEAVYTRDLFDKRTGDNRFRRSNEYELVGRYGKIIAANFLPYARLGIGQQDYQYFAGTRKTNFHGVLWTPGVGVQAFIKENIFIRTEASYQWATSIKSKGIKVDRKPHGPHVWGGIGIRF